MFYLLRTHDDVSRADFEEALEIVAHNYQTTSYDLRRNYRIRLVNLVSGREELRRLTREEPTLDPSCSYGWYVEIKQTHFIYVNPYLWRNGVDLVPTFIHELLHMMEPNKSEQEIRLLEREICNDEEIEIHDVLDPFREPEQSSDDDNDEDDDDDSDENTDED